MSQRNVFARCISIPVKQMSSVSLELTSKISRGLESSRTPLFSCIKVWDLRNMSAVKYCLQTNRSCYGAYYNQAGSHIMAATRDDQVMSFAVDDMQGASDPLHVAPTKKINHRNYVNRFVTPFTAQPYSFIESHFLIGSNGYPREVSFATDEPLVSC